MACDDSNVSTATDTAAEYNFSTREGSDQKLGFRYKDADDEIVPLINIDKITFTARSGFKGTLALSLICEIDLENNIFYIPFTKENTQGLSGRRSKRSYKYDIQTDYQDGVVVTYMAGNWDVLPDVPNT